MAPEPESWIPIESLESLPELEELLDPKTLVDSGQTRALRIDAKGRGYVYGTPKSSKNIAERMPISQIENRKQGRRHDRRHDRRLSHLKWMSKKRTILLQRRVRYQRAIAGVVVVLLAIVLLVLPLKPQSAFASFSSDSSAFSESSSSHFIPTLVPIILEGKQVTVLSAAESIEEFQNEQHLEKLISTDSSFSRSDFINKRSVPVLEFRYKKSITINVDGQVSTMSGTELTIAEFLDANKISVDADDIVSPSRESFAYGVKQVTVNRVSSSSRSVEEALPYKIEKINDATLLKGKTKVQRKGVNGIQLVTYAQTLQNDGSLMSEVRAGVTVKKEAVTEIIHVGTRKPQMESGKASYYSAESGTCAHKTLPKGTIITVTNTRNGKSASCRVADRGPYVNGRVIDLSKDVFASIGSLSSGVISVSLTW